MRFDRSKSMGDTTAQGLEIEYKVKAVTLEWIIDTKTQSAIIKVLNEGFINLIKLEKKYLIMRKLKESYRLLTKVVASIIVVSKVTHKINLKFINRHKQGRAVIIKIMFLTTNRE